MGERFLQLRATGKKSYWSCLIEPYRNFRSKLCRVLCQFRKPFTVTLGGSDDLHFLPVVRKFFSAIQASHISSGQNSGLGAARCPTNGYREAVMSVPAAEHCINQFPKHRPTFHT
jgi:hypothetical protein